MYSAAYRPCLAYLWTHGDILHRSRPRGGGRGGKGGFFNGDAYSQPKEYESQSEHLARRLMNGLFQNPEPVRSSVFFNASSQNKK